MVLRNAPRVRGAFWCGRLKAPYSTTSCLRKDLVSPSRLRVPTAGMPAAACCWRRICPPPRTFRSLFPRGGSCGTCPRLRTHPPIQRTLPRLRICLPPYKKGTPCSSVPYFVRGGLPFRLRPLFGIGRFGRPFSSCFFSRLGLARLYAPCSLIINTGQHLLPVFNIF